MNPLRGQESRGSSRYLGNTGGTPGLLNDLNGVHWLWLHPPYTPSAGTSIKVTVLPEKWATNNSLGKHHVKVLATAQTQNRLMSRRPKSATGPYMDDLFLPAVVTGDRQSEIRLFQLCLAHERPPAAILEAGRSSVNWISV
jgi:hypothetical protein